MSSFFNSRRSNCFVHQKPAVFLNNIDFQFCFELCFQLPDEIDADRKMIRSDNSDALWEGEENWVCVGRESACSVHTWFLTILFERMDMDPETDGEASVG